MNGTSASRALTIFQRPSPAELRHGEVDQHQIQLSVAKACSTPSAVSHAPM
jgi:hypothetical protein